MKTYKLDILIHNDLGELLDVQKSFSSIEDLNMFMTDSLKMHELWCEAEKNGKEDGLLLEELFDSKADFEFNVN